MHFQYITIIVKDLAASVDFYQTMTKLHISRELSPGGATKIAFLRNAEGATEIELVENAEMQGFQGKGFFLSFHTDALDEMHALASAKNLNPSDIRSPNETSRYFYVYDPNGVSIQLTQNQ